MDDEECAASDELMSEVESSENEDAERSYPFFNEKTGYGKHIELIVGMRFRNRDVFRSALVDFANRKGFDFDYINNKGARISAQCKTDTCPWRISASVDVDKYGGECFQIKSMVPHQNCGRSLSSSRLSSKYLALNYLQEFRDNSNWEIDAFQLRVSHEFGIDAGYKKCWRAKTIALSIIDGTVGEQYQLLKEYCAAIKKWNPDTSICLSTDAGHFQRIYICLDACKRGFLVGCRPIISLDACHLKGAYNGQIHSAVGRDGNDNMFLIAYALCESESKDSWSWFLRNLLDDIGDSRENGWCFISDQQKGLQPAVKELVPYSEHRFCVRHLYANFKKAFKGKELKDAMWACARSSTHSQFKRAVEYIKGLDKDADTHLSKLDPATWSRHGFSYFSKSDALCSNISESFNAFIKKARDKPIIVCLETIRKLIMKRLYEMRISMEKYPSDICPRILEKLEGNIKDSTLCNVTYGGGPSFQVERTLHEAFVVNVATRSCTCRLWELSGIPCSHSCAAIRYMRGNPMDYVHQSYTKSCFLKTYEPYIDSMPGASDWPAQHEEAVLPPLFRRQAGRPRRRRIREVGEPVNPHQKRKGGHSSKCGRCGCEGHNKRSCKGEVADPKKFEERKKDAERAAKHRLKKITWLFPLILFLVRRKKATQAPLVIREAQVCTNELPSRNWHAEYDTLGTAISYDMPICHGPTQISVRGGQAMFTRVGESSSSTSGIKHL